MMYFFFPLESLLRLLRQQPHYRPYALAGALLVTAVLVAIGFYFRKYFTFISKSLFRNLVRTLLSSLAIMVLVFVITLIWSVLLFLDLIMTEKSKDLKAIVTERYQIPSQMPFAYERRLAEGANRPDHPGDMRPEDSMSWQFFGGSMDPANRTWENSLFMFALDPRVIDPRRPGGPMMEDLENLDPALIDKMLANKRGILVGRERLRNINKRVGERLTVTSFNYKDIELEFEILGLLPEGRYDQSAIMNRDYLNDAIYEDYPRKHRGEAHPLAMKSLNLEWLRVPDQTAFSKVATQVTTSSEFTNPFVKCETASSGIAAWLDSYRDLLWGAKWLLVPGIMITMALVIANAISISVRERRTEMAVLKVLGFSPGRILALVLGEAVLVGAGSGLLSAILTYVLIHVLMGGLKFPIAFFPIFDIYADAMWWGLAFGGLTALAGSIVPAWSARTVKVSEVFAKVG